MSAVADPPRAPSAPPLSPPGDSAPMPPGPRPDERPGWASFALGAICFCGLVWLAAAHWGALLRPPATGDFLVLALVAAGCGLLTVVAERVQRHASLVRGISGLLMVVTIALAAGLSARYLWPGTWDDQLPAGVASGVAVLFTERVPLVAAREPWAATLLLIMFGILVAGGVRLLLHGAPFAAALVIVAVDAVAMAQLPPHRPLLVGIAIALLLLGALVARRPQRSAGAAVVLAGFAAAGIGAAVLVAAAVDRGRPLIDPTEVVAGLTGRTDARHFSWGQSYDPQTWPRTGERVARVRIRGRMPYLKAAVLETFDGRAWQVTSGGARPERTGWDAGATRRMEVRIDALETRQFLGAGSTVGIQNSTSAIEQHGLGSFDVRGDPLTAGDRYDAMVIVPTVSTKERRQTGSDFAGVPASELTVSMPDPDFGRGATARVQFPAWDSGEPIRVQRADGHWDDDPEAFLEHSDYRRTWALAQRLAARSQTPAGFTAAVLRRVRDGARYTETPPSSRNDPAPLETFLFRTKQGYCQHYSGAMALILRMGGVPARVASGFLPGSEENGVHVIRDTDAHAWVETFVPGKGWVTDDPTPPIATGQTALGGDPETDVATSSAAGSLLDRARDLAARRRAERRGTESSVGARQPTTAQEERRGTAATVLLVVAVGVAVVAALTAILMAMALLRRRRTASPALAEVHDALVRTGRGDERSTTLAAVEQLVADDAAASAYVRALREARYAAPGDPVATPTAAGRRALRRALARGRGWRGRIGALVALPPLLGVPQRS